MLDRPRQPPRPAPPAAAPPRRAARSQRDPSQAPGGPARSPRPSSAQKAADCQSSGAGMRKSPSAIEPKSRTSPTPKCSNTRDNHRRNNRRRRPPTRASSVSSAAGISTSKQRQDEHIHRQRKDRDAVEVDRHGQRHRQFHHAGDDHQFNNAQHESAPPRERRAMRDHGCPPLPAARAAIIRSITRNCASARRQLDVHRNQAQIARGRRDRDEWCPGAAARPRRAMATTASSVICRLESKRLRGLTASRHSAAKPMVFMGLRSR